MTIDLQDTIAAELEARGMSPEDLVAKAGHTFVPDPVAPTVRDEAPAPLKRPPDTARTKPRSKRVDIEAVAGLGGMAVVWSGTQHSLGRRVAVKARRTEVASDVNGDGLLQEAYVTGELEHPNIVPVHDIEETGDGDVLVILKHVDGVPWSDLVHDPKRARELLGVEELLEWNLDVLSQLCNAVRFAHERGFIHRDLKPANVLIGKFGEVALADWGIAVRMEDDGSGRFPLRADAKSFAGTPAYMAPEMLGGRAEEIGVPTDVYLLGAVLYEAVCGAPPHAAPSFQGLIGNIVASTPRLPADLDPELGELIRHAMQPRPGDRMATVGELQRGLARYRSHRHSRRLSAAAAARSAEVVLPAEGDKPEQGEADAYGLLAESRFGYRQALETWPENEEARGGLGLVVEKMIAMALAREEPGAAARLLREHPAPPENLQTRVHEAQERAAARRRELEQIESEFDPHAGLSGRTFLLVSVGAMFVAAPALLAFAFQSRLLTDSQEIGVLSTLGLIIGSGLAVWLTRKQSMGTPVNRRVVVSLFAVLGAQALLFAGDLAFGTPAQESVVRLMLLLALVMTLMAIQYSWRLLISAGTYLACHFAGVVYPEWRLHLLTAGNAAFALNLVWLRRWGIATFGPEDIRKPQR